MAGEWRRTKLGDVVEINPEALGSDWPYDHIRYVDISSVGEGFLIELPRHLSITDAPSRAKRLVRSGDTILSTVRPNRRSMYFVKESSPDLVVSTGFAVLRPRENLIEPRYLYACVFDKNFTEYLVSREKGAAYPAVLPEDIADAVINLPPLPEQRAIAAVLGALDDKIELNRRMNRTLEAIAQAVFRHWFVENEEAEGWEVGKFSDISFIARDVINPAQFPSEVFNHYSIPAYDEKRFPISELGSQIKSSKFVVPNNCVLISKLNPEIPRIWLPFSLKGRSICSTEFLVNVPTGYFSPEYLYGLFHSQSFQDRFRLIGN